MTFYLVMTMRAKVTLKLKRKLKGKALVKQWVTVKVSGSGFDDDSVGDSAVMSLAV